MNSEVTVIARKKFALTKLNLKDIAVLESVQLPF